MSLVVGTSDRLDAMQKLLAEQEGHFQSSSRLSIP